MKASRPGLEAEQRQGRSLLWDKKQDQEFLEEFALARVAQKSYVYQNGS
jgi:hypothetical protein